MTEWNEPPTFQVYVTCPVPGQKKLHTSRVGVTRDKREIAKIIADDKKAMGETFGGLLAPTSTKGRVYRAFEAKWTEIKL